MPVSIIQKIFLVFHREILTGKALKCERKRFGNAGRKALTYRQNTPRNPGKREKTPNLLRFRALGLIRFYSRPMRPSQIFAAVVQYSEISKGFATSVS